MATLIGVFHRYVNGRVWLGPIDAVLILCLRGKHDAISQVILLLESSTAVFTRESSIGVPTKVRVRRGSLISPAYTRV